MAKLKKESVFKDGLQVLTADEFAKKYGNGVKKEAIYYAIRQGLVDFIPIGNRNYVVTTANTLAYTPNKSPKRIVKKATKKRVFKK